MNKTSSLPALSLHNKSVPCPAEPVEAYLVLGCNGAVDRPQPVQQDRIISHFGFLWLILLFLFAENKPVLARQPGTQWSPEKAWAWYNQQPWPCGFNYIPANAINYTAMWDKTSFSPEVIDKELQLASQTGFNCARVVLQYAVWENDPAYFKKTLAQFLAIADKHHIKVMPCFFDDCVFNDQHDPKIGVQPEPVIGWYAWAWSPSPGHTMVADTTSYLKLEHYVKDVMKEFRKDKRLFVWDLYNEPTNGGLGAKSLPLVRSVFRWAREINPMQPITIGYWSDNAALAQLIETNADITTFHNYGPAEKMRENITRLQSQQRPMICTEWLNRPRGSIVATVLPELYEQKVGAMSWGLVNGKTQTHLPWGHRPGNPEPAVWQHDLYRNDQTIYDPAEIELFKELIKNSTTRTYQTSHAH